MHLCSAQSALSFSPGSSVKFFLTAASLRDGSLNVRLAHDIARRLREAGHEAELTPFHELVTPNYDEGLRAEGFPAGAENWKTRMLDADATILVSPEYNYSIPGHLKNTIDWVSRYRPIPFRGIPLFLASASPSLIGGNRGLWATRIPLESLGAHVHPDMFSLAQAANAFTEDGMLADASTSERLQGQLDGFTSFASRVGPKAAR